VLDVLSVHKALGYGVSAGAVIARLDQQLELQDTDVGPRRCIASDSRSHPLILGPRSPVRNTRCSPYLLHSWVHVKNGCVLYPIDPSNMASLRISVPCRPRQSHLTLSIVHRRAFSKSPTTCSSQYDRSDLQGQPFSASYDPEQPTQGPLGGVSSHGAPQITPRKLKAYLDRHVVGQERPKKMMAVAVYNHYQRIRELRRQEEEEKERLAKLMRTKYNRSAVHPVEGKHMYNICLPKNY
jgi:hypothetical protein